MSTHDQELKSKFEDLLDELFSRLPIVYHHDIKSLIRRYDLPRNRCLIYLENWCDKNSDERKFILHETKEGTKKGRPKKRYTKLKEKINYSEPVKKIEMKRIKYEDKEDLKKFDDRIEREERHTTPVFIDFCNECQHEIYIKLTDTAFVPTTTRVLDEESEQIWEETPKVQYYQGENFVGKRTLEGVKSHSNEDHSYFCYIKVVYSIDHNFENLSEVELIFK